MDRRRRRHRRRRVSAAVSMTTEHMRDGVTRAIRRWAYHGGGFSCWHTRAVSWAVSAAFTFLPKIEGYGGGSFFLCLSYLPPSSFSTLFPFSLYQLLYFPLSFSFPSIPLSALVFYIFHFLFLSFSRRVVSFRRTRIIFKYFSRWTVTVHVSAGHVRLSSYDSIRLHSPQRVHVSKQEKNKWKCRSVDGINVERFVHANRSHDWQRASWNFSRLLSFEDPRASIDLDGRCRTQFQSRTQSAREEPCRQNWEIAHRVDATRINRSFSAAPVKLPDHVSSARVARRARRGEMRVERVYL